MPFNEELPEWNQEGAEPSQEKKDGGFAVLERPPAGLFDWFFHRTFSSLKEIQEKAMLKEDANNFVGKSELTTHVANRNHVFYADDIGFANEKRVSINPVPTSYSRGLGISFTNRLTNSGQVTLKVNDLEPKPILSSNGSVLTNGSLIANSVYTVRYNGSAFILQGERGEIGTATKNDVLQGKTVPTENGLVEGAIPLKNATNGDGTGANRHLPTKIENDSGKVYARAWDKDSSIPTAFQGDSWIEVNEPNFISQNIRSGLSMFGMLGTMQPGSQVIQVGASIVNTLDAFTIGQQLSLPWIPFAILIRFKFDNIRMAVLYIEGYTVYIQYTGVGGLANGWNYGQYYFLTHTQNNAANITIPIMRYANGWQSASSKVTEFECFAISR